MKKLWGVILILLLALMFGFGWGYAIAAPNTGLIVGKIYADTQYPYGALNNGDALITEEITGLSIVLYTEVPVPGKENTFQMVNVARATIKDGEYRFNVKPGKYYVGTVYNSDTMLYYPRYNTVHHIGGGTLEVKYGKTILGPTIFLTNERG